jgi:diketogulonate reductase-like aldo/keto reductase
MEVVRHPHVAAISARFNASPAQIVFAFARQVGMLPLTGTTNAEHMKQDLESRSMELPQDAVNAIEAIAG